MDEKAQRAISFRFGFVRNRDGAYLMTLRTTRETEEGKQEASLAAEQENAFAPGTILGGKYRIERQLGEGGLGVVVVATHLDLNQLVAIKYLHPRILERPKLVERFRREAQLAASIRSDHVVRVYDVGVHEAGGPYMVMEYLEGEDLGAKLVHGPLLPEEGLDYIVQACDALAEAHALGIIHRDLKPENIFVATRKGAAPIVKVLDFGISKTIDKRNGSIPDAQEARPRKMTENNERFGTPEYMSPEQLLSSTNVDARSDIWALGIVLFELLTGEPPFQGESTAHLGANILHGTPTRLREKLPSAAPDLEAVITKCLEKSPDDRYRNVAELVDELAAFGAPQSQARIARIKFVTREGGESIRPPRPRSTPLSEPSTSVPVVIPAYSIDPTQPAAVEGAAGQGRGRSRTIIAGVAAALLTAVLATGAVVMRARPPSPVTAASAAPSVAGDPLTASPASVAPMDPPPVLVVPEPSLSGAGPGAPSKTTAAAPTPPKAIAKPASTGSAKKKSDYSEFGERR